MMQGGWEFVGAAYAVAYGALALYAVSLHRRVAADLALAPVPKSTASQPKNPGGRR